MNWAMVTLVGMAPEVPGTAGWSRHKALVIPAFPKSLSAPKGSEEWCNWSSVQLYKAVVS